MIRTAILQQYAYLYIYIYPSNNFVYYNVADVKGGTIRANIRVWALDANYYFSGVLDWMWRNRFFFFFYNIVNMIIRRLLFDNR